jgi:hypothetical protein
MTPRRTQDRRAADIAPIEWIAGGRMYISRLFALALIISLMLPSSAGGADDVMLSMTNKVTSIKKPRILVDLSNKQCLLDKLPCESNLDCDGAFNLCVPVSVEPIDDVVLIDLATDIYHTIGIKRACSQSRTIAISLDATTPVQVVKQELILQLLETALAGPLRTKFWVAQDQCINVLDRDYPVVIGVQIILEKE